MSQQKIRLKYAKPLNLPRRVVAHITSTAWQNVPHVSYLYEPDITDFYGEYKALAKEKGVLGKRLSLNTIMLRVIVEGLKAAPDLNAVIDYHHQTGAGTINVCEDINISLPWLLADGNMITPIIFDAGAMTLDQLSDAVVGLGEKILRTNVEELLYQVVRADTLRELQRGKLSVIRRVFNRARGLFGKEKTDYYKIPTCERLTETDLLGGTVTISNIGSLYKDQRGYFCLLDIIPPQIFVVGLGAIQEKPGICIDNEGKHIAIRQTLPMCLAFDHRAVDFSTLIPFIKKLDEFFSEPRVIHEW